MLPATFDALVEEISGDAVFLSHGITPQLPVEHQLAIALFRFGHFGNTAAVEAVAQFAGVSAGAVVKSTCRVMRAFLEMSNRVICWPTAEEKEGAKMDVEEISCAGWRDGFCMVDGTLIPLSDKPGFHGEVYFDRKSNYSFNLQVSCQKIQLLWTYLMSIELASTVVDQYPQPPNN